MKTVEQILDEVYGGKHEASAALGSKRNSPWNWRKNGHFPVLVAIQISQDAKEKGIELPLDEIPTFDKKAHAA